MNGNALWPALSSPGAPDTISELISQTDYNISPWKSTFCLKEEPGNQQGSQVAFPGGKMGRPRSSAWADVHLPSSLLNILNKRIMLKTLSTNFRKPTEK